MSTQDAGHFHYGFQAPSHGALDHGLQELENVIDGAVIPEVSDGFLKDCGAVGMLLAGDQGIGYLAGLASDMAALRQDRPPSGLQQFFLLEAGVPQAGHYRLGA